MCFTAFLSCICCIEIYFLPSQDNTSHGPLTRYAKWRVVHASGMSGTFSELSDFKGNRQLTIPASHVLHARAVMYAGIAKPWWQGKRSRHSRRMRNPQFCVSGKTPMAHLLVHAHVIGMQSGVSTTRVSHRNSQDLICQHRLAKLAVRLWRRYLILST